MSLLKNERVTRNCDLGVGPTGVRSQWSGRTPSFFNTPNMSIRITKSEALKLFENASLESLQKAAHAKRCKIVPDKKATYIIMRILSYTNVCIADCSYCDFYRRPGDPEGYVLSEKEIFQKLDELQAVGGSLAAMEGGFNPTLKLEHYENLV